MNWNDIRSQFPILNQYTYLNTARFGALPQAVSDLQKRYINSLATHGSWGFDEWLEKYEGARDLAAGLIGASNESVFFIPNVSTGINLSSLYLPRQKVVLVAGDFPSVTLPWKSHDHDVQTLKYQDDNFYEQLEGALQEGNKILCVSWVQSEDGFELDLEKVYRWCKTFDCLLVLDGTQGLGTIPFRIDPEVSMVFLAATWKWLLSGYGCSIGYVSNDLLPLFKAFQGWHSIDYQTGNAKIGAASLEVGNALYFNVLGLYEGLRIIQEIGVDQISIQNLSLRDDWMGRLKDIGRTVQNFEQSRSSIFRIDATQEEYQKLVSAGIQTSVQKGRIRFSPHFYNQLADIEPVISAL